jgi:fatty acid desaturase
LGIAGFLRSELRHLRAGTDGARRRWALHLPLAVAWSALVWQVAGFPFWQYALATVWLGTSVTQLRSFAEHRWTPEGSSRTAMVRANRLMSLLFLNNNLHVAHHLKPGAPWYVLPRLADELDCDTRASAGAGLYRGYGEIVRRYLLRPFDQPVHPAEIGRQRAPRVLRGSPTA